ncbi:MAG: class I SAM-dependent methyltransferase [Cyanobacteria bacterium J06627_8]
MDTQPSATDNASINDNALIHHRALRSLFGLIIGADNQAFYETVNWPQEIQRVQNAHIAYPDYYRAPQFHGIDGGYLTSVAAITYDIVTAFASPPSERWVRQQLITHIQGQPFRILDLGCGTGSTTVMLKQAYPNADVIGLDLSPYMLLMAERKSQQTQQAIALHHGLAEATGFDSASFDVVTASFLFHETPPVIAQAILHECFRLTTSGGQVLILDGNQNVLRHLHWLIDLFREPYSKVYAAGCMDRWFLAAHFVDVQTKSIGWIHQLTTGKKP